ncbi:TIGR01777 family oxidoreductase [Actinopolymorpha pittospori]
MRYVLAGASGFLGRALRERLIGEGHEVTQLVRRAPQSPDQTWWDPARGQLEAGVLAGAGAVVNLSGATVGRVPWTSGYRRTLRESRIGPTTTLATALADMSEPPVLVSQSATGYYGMDRGAEELDEDSPSGDGFLAGLARDWESATEPAAKAGVRVVKLRTSAVFDQSGGVLRLLQVPFRLGVGGRLGSGRQYMPMVSLDDWLAAVRFTVDRADAQGSYNVTLPHPATNAELTSALGAAFHRPTLLPVPGLALRTGLGEFSAELAGSRRLVPRRLLEAGFSFSAPDVTSMVAAALHRS